MNMICFSDLLLINYLGGDILSPLFKLIVKKKHEPEVCINMYQVPWPSRKRF